MTLAGGTLANLVVLANGTGYAASPRIILTLADSIFGSMSSSAPDGESMLFLLEGTLTEITYSATAATAARNTQGHRDSKRRSPPSGGAPEHDDDDFPGGVKLPSTAIVTAAVRISVPDPVAASAPDAPSPRHLWAL